MPRVQLVGTVEDLVAEHRQLIGPRHHGEPIPGVATIVRASHTDRQSTLLVRTAAPITDPAWTVREVTLEDLTLAYLADGDAQDGDTKDGHTKGTHSAWGVSA
jgi:ABC-2 type transport system ATP-binding protein